MFSCLLEFYRSVNWNLQKGDVQSENSNMECEDRKRIYTGWIIKKVRNREDNTEQLWKWVDSPDAPAVGSDCAGTWHEDQCTVWIWIQIVYQSIDDNRIFCHWFPDIGKQSQNHFFSSENCAIMKKMEGGGKMNDIRQKIDGLLGKITSDEQLKRIYNFIKYVYIYTK